MWIILNWPTPVYIKGVIIYNTLNRSRDTSKNKKNKKHRTNESENDHALSLNFFRNLSSTHFFLLQKLDIWREFLERRDTS